MESPAGGVQSSLTEWSHRRGRGVHSSLTGWRWDGVTGGRGCRVHSRGGVTGRRGAEFTDGVESPAGGGA